jgi:2-phosphosulfolactate phosphatase
MLIDRIFKRGGALTLTDASLAARVLFQRFESNLLEALRSSHHGKDLLRLGLGDDLAYCAQTDICSIVPVFKDGVIRVHHE